MTKTPIHLNEKYTHIITTNTALPPSSVARWSYVVDTLFDWKMLFNFNVFRWSISCVRANRIGTRTILLDFISIYSVSPINYSPRFMKNPPLRDSTSIGWIGRIKTPKKTKCKKYFIIARNEKKRRIWHKMWREYTISGTAASSLSIYEFVESICCASWHGSLFFYSRFKFLLPHFSFIFEHGKWNARTHAHTSAGP